MKKQSTRQEEKGGFPQMLSRLFTVVGFVLLLSAVPVMADAPVWFKQAAIQQVPSYPKDVPAVVLLDEQQVTLGSDGKLVTIENYAVRLLNSDGRGFATASAYYLVSSGKVREIEAWLARPNSAIKTYDKKSVVDIIADTDDVYNEGRLKIIDASRDVGEGDVFGYTIISEDLPLFYQEIWRFQGRLPTLNSRYTINLPQGWKANSVTFNHEDVQARVNGSSYTWELQNLPPVPPEPMSPSLINLVPRIAVNFSPLDSSQSVDRAFADWLDVSRWATKLYDPQVIVDDSIAIKARELTANAKTEFEKIRAIGNYVQNLQYISIDIGVGHGNGYKPRTSTLVLSRGYGDCKDKANLMRALLRSMNIEAYPVAIYSGDPTYVKTEWASPRQFNHCIIAVKVSDSTESATVMNHPQLGRLLVFDATDPYTPVGDLPGYLQGSKGLVIAGEKGGLSEMPITPPDADLLERQIEATLSPLGELKGTIREVANGQTSTAFRSEVRGLSAPDYKQAIEGWLTRGATGARLVKLDQNDRQQDAAFDLNVEFAVPNYGQLMQGRLLIFKPVVVGRRRAVSLTEKSRQHPIELDSGMVKETAVFTLPTGFVVDEVPEEVNMDSPFGKYTTKFEVKEGKLHFTRMMQVNRSVISPDKYNEVKGFFAKMLEAEQSAVVLMRK